MGVCRGGVASGGVVVADSGGVLGISVVGGVFVIRLLQEPLERVGRLQIACEVKVITSGGAGAEISVEAQHANSGRDSSG